MTSREAFEIYMYGDEESTTRIDAQKETRQHFKTWQAAWDAATKIELERCTVVVDEFHFWLGRQAKREIVEAIRTGEARRNIPACVPGDAELDR